MRVKLVWSLALLLCSPPVFAQETEPESKPESELEAEIDRLTEGTERLPEVIVTPARRPAPRFKSPYSSEVVPKAALSGVAARRSLPDALGEVPGVMMQRTGPGQGSAYLRGLTGFQTLLLIDGIRLNHSAFRAGPNQYLATVDHLSLARSEVVFGPASVLYGSDAMGGAINMIPLSPERVDGEYPFGGRVLTRVAHAERSFLSRIEVHGGFGEEFGFLGGVDRKLFGDYYDGDGLVRNTSYDEWAGDLRLVWHPEDALTLTLAWQRVSQDDVPRTHRTVFSKPFRGTTPGNERTRDLTQVRDLLYLRATLDEPLTGVDVLTATASWQRQRESRFRRRTDGRTDRQGFTVDTLGLQLEAQSTAPVGELTWGIDVWRDRVDSFSRSYAADGSLTSMGIQGPVADDATYDLLGLFLQDEVEILPHLTLLAGARLTRAALDADEVANPRTGNRISISEDDSSLVGSLRATWTGIPDWSFYGGVSQGFRSPNLSDLTRFDTARSDEIETPVTGLDPEESLSFEVGARTRMGPVRAEVAVFHTELYDLIQRFPTGRTIDGNREVTKANIGDGFVRGIEAGGEVILGNGFTAFGGGAFVVGKAETFPTSRRVLKEEYLDRLPPLTGRLGLRWEDLDGRSAVAVLRMADKADRLSTRDEGDTQRIPPGGTPGYAVLDLAVSLPLRSNVTLTLGVDNVFDRTYRIHGSGQNQPGRNVYFVLEVRF